MGWTGLHREKGLSDREFFEREFAQTLTERGHILRCTTRPGMDGQRVFYAAVKGASQNPDEVWCLVVLMKWYPRGWENFVYKEMGDAVGPAEDGCPIEILDLLSPTDSQWANDWRNRCRSRAEHETRAKARRATLTDDTIVRFDEPWNFGDRGEHRFLRYRQFEEHRRVWEVLDDNGRFCFAGLLPRDWWKRNWSAAAKCANCGALLRDTSDVDPNVPWVHELSGNGFCDVACPEDAVRLAGTAGRAIAVPA